MAGARSIPVGTYCYIDGYKEFCCVIEKSLPHKQYHIVDLFQNRSRIINEKRLEIILNNDDLQNATTQYLQYLMQKQQKEQEERTQHTSVHTEEEEVKLLQQPRSSVSTKHYNEIFDETLTKELQDTAQNQLNFFKIINQWYSELLINDYYDYNKQGNSRIYWESIIIDYEHFMAKLAEDSYFNPSMSMELELIWRVHLLNPQCYVSDCLRKFGKIIDHSCAEPHVQYIRHNTKRFRKKVLKQGRHLARTGFIGSNLIMIDALKRQCKFIRKIFKINLFTPITLTNIHDSITRYNAFLQLIWRPDKPSGLIMVPTLDIDLIWHSHQLNPGFFHFCFVCVI